VAWHIKIGKLSWCRSPYARRRDLFIGARDEGIVLTCSHVSKQKAQRAVAFLQQHGIDFVRLADGVCREAAYSASENSET
jgi:hypothetical protein